MIETCTKRRMITSIIGLAVLTIIILILEAKLTSRASYGYSPTPYPNNFSGVLSDPHEAATPASIPQSSSLFNHCWNNESFKVIEECSPCSKFELNSKTPIACQETGLKEVIQCEKFGKTFKSCPVTKTIERRRFWIFESLMLLLGVLSFGYSKLRRSQLDRKTIKQIERRLAAGH